MLHERAHGADRLSRGNAPAGGGGPEPARGVAALSRHIGGALAVVLVPDAFEVLLVLVNVQWVLAAALVLLLLAIDPQRPREYFHDVAAATLLGLTGTP